MKSALYAALCGLALATASALPHRHLTKAKKDMDELKKKVDGQDDYQSSYKKKEKHSTNVQVAYASCRVDTYADAYSGYRDTFIDAVVHAHKSVCSKDFDPKYMEKTIEDWAIVFAGATAEAYVSCQSFATDQAYAQGCGWGKAAAKACEYAFAGAYADAIAEVEDKKYCGCEKQEIWTEVQAGLFQIITAEAFAKAEAAACVEGNEWAEAYSLVDCYAQVFTKLFAQAIAQVVVDAECYYGDGASVFAYVDSTSYHYEVCEVETWSTPGAWARGRGRTDTSS